MVHALETNRMVVSVTHSSLAPSANYARWNLTGLKRAAQPLMVI